MRVAIYGAGGAAVVASIAVGHVWWMVGFCVVLFVGWVIRIESDSKPGDDE